MATRRTSGGAARKKLLRLGWRILKRYGFKIFVIHAVFFFLLFPSFSVTCSSSSLSDQAQPEASSQNAKGDDSCRSCLSFNELDKKIRDGRKNRSAAMAEVPVLLSGVKDYYYQMGCRDFSQAEWVFPVEGYTGKAIGGRGRGYKAKGYDYFDGNRHKAHPSHDIFIQDKNRDEMDDISRKPVRIFCMTGGIVVATEPNWEPGSNLRGGKYIWIYSPSDNALVYYAHNRELLVKPGDIVKLGDPISIMGRTGLNAAKSRSPTHLHITYLKVKDGYPVPLNIYGSLLKAVVRR
jgi:peptidoglycan LD-endopeptidase LytH